MRAAHGECKSEVCLTGTWHTCCFQEGEEFQELWCWISLSLDSESLQFFQ